MNPQLLNLGKTIYNFYFLVCSSLFCCYSKMQLNLILPVATIYGILTVNTQQQIDERLGGAHGHKGEEAALAALKMISLTPNC